MTKHAGRNPFPDTFVSALIESFPEIFFLFDREGRMLSWNRHAEEVTGYGTEEIAGMHPLAFFHEDEHPAVREAIETAFTEGSAQVEAELHTREGRRLPYLFAGSGMEVDGVPVLCGFAIDIGTRRRAEAALRESEAHYRALVEQSLTGVYMIREGIFTYVNQRLAGMFGYTQEELVDRLGPLDLIAPEDRDAVQERVRQRVTGEVHSAHYTARGLRKDGSRLWLEIHGTRVDFGKGPMITGSLIDITQRKEAEEALTESRRFLETLVDNLPGVVYRCRNDRDWTMDFISDACTMLMGHTPAEMMAPGQPTLGMLIHADDRELVWDTVQDALQRGEPFQITYRLGHRDGFFRWVWEQGRGVFDEDGELIGLEGFINDITAQKQARDELQRLADRLHTTLESITDAFYTVDRDWRFTYVNREAERVLERPRETLLGSAIWEALPDLRESTLEAEFRRSANENVSLRFEYYRQLSGRWHEYHVYPSGEGLAVYFRDITREKNDREQIEFLALYDPVTQLPNRRLLEDRLGRALATSNRNRSRGALLFIDLDDFKSVNDSLGHDQGDILLQQVAKRLSGCLRQNDTVARFGGDEFAVVLEGIVADPDEARIRMRQVAEKLRDVLEQPFQLAGQTCYTTASIGITEFGDGDETIQELLKRADLAMYQAKEGGRNTTRLFEPLMETAAATRMQIETDLREALENGTIDVHYQPQVDAEGRITSAEALARWRHPVRGPISPAEFIPVAEHTGLIVPLGQTVLEQACRQLARWMEHSPTPEFTMAINVSARQFHDRDYIDDTLATIGKAGVEPARIRLELTESMLLEDIERSMNTMLVLKAHGVRFSLDDFGTGYSSLAYLKSLPLDQLKIDQTFVRNMATDPNDAAIVRAIIAIAESLGLGVVAEGVETEAARQLLAEYGCVQYQGYLFSPPMPAREFESFSAWPG